MVRSVMMFCKFNDSTLTVSEGRLFNVLRSDRDVTPPTRGDSGAASGPGRVVMTYLRAASCAAGACFGVSTGASYSLYGSSGLPWLNMPPRFDMLAVSRWMLTCGDGMRFLAIVV
jgi:hypothetical protein